MKKLSILTILMMISLLISVDMAQANRGRVGNRQIKQQKRIHHGLQSGKLTRKEATHLEREQHRIQKTKQKALRDGELTPKERLRLKRQQDQANKHIYRLKHNEKTK